MRQARFLLFRLAAAAEKPRAKHPAQQRDPEKHRIIEHENQLQLRDFRSEFPGSSPTDRHARRGNVSAALNERRYQAKKTQRALQLKRTFRPIDEAYKQMLLNISDGKP